MQLLKAGFMGWSHSAACLRRGEVLCLKSSSELDNQIWRKNTWRDCPVGKAAEAASCVQTVRRVLDRRHREGERGRSSGRHRDKDKEVNWEKQR